MSDGENAKDMSSRELIRELNAGEVRVFEMWVAEKTRLTEQIAGLQKVLATVENTLTSLAAIVAGGDGKDAVVDTNNWCLYRTRDIEAELSDEIFHPEEALG